MNENLKTDAKISVPSNNRTCQPQIGLKEDNLHNNNNASYVSPIPNPHKTAHHTLSIMPSYRYANSDTSTATFSLLPALSRRRWLQRQTCLFCIIAAFMFGLVLGVFVPLLDLRNVFTTTDIPSKVIAVTFSTPRATNNNPHTNSLADLNWVPPQDLEGTQRTSINHTKYAATNDELSAVQLSPFSVAFINERQAKIETAEILSDSAQNPSTHASYKSVNKRDYQEMASSAQATLPQAVDKRAPKALHTQDDALSSTAQALNKNVLQPPTVQKSPTTTSSSTPTTPSIIRAHIYWGELVERALPQGFSAQDTRDWNAYVGASQTAVQRLEPGCGRMQNRLLIFEDGTRACARYRQNTDQIQGELFSFYLGRLLNMSNLAPSAVLTVNLDSEKWAHVVRDITQAQWKQQRPVVLTRWLPNLEPAGIPQPFQPLDRHLNKYDVWNLTASLLAPHASVQRKRAQATHNLEQLSDALDTPLDLTITPNSLALERLVELAQWSDLIVFDYLIANLDRVVNNLYNYQWNAEIMAAPAHNLARKSNSQLLIFLDNESGLLHGYRLLKKYEAYHGLLLNNLCVFREPTIRALRQLRAAGAGRKLREFFVQTTSEEVRDVLPTLPDKSIKILIDRIDRVLGQVDNCRQLMNAR